jgi:hypothetical protein
LVPPCVSAKGLSDYFNRIDVMDDLNVDYEEEHY